MRFTAASTFASTVLSCLLWQSTQGLLVRKDAPAGRSLAQLRALEESNGVGRRRLADVRRRLEKCEFYPEIVLVQDVSYSYKEPLVAMQELLPDFLEHLKVNLGGRVKFGVTEFVDKPVHPYGLSTRFEDDGTEDYCAKVRYPLRAIDEEGVVEAAQAAIGDMRSGGGADIPDGAILGAYRSALSDSVGWGPNVVDSQGRKQVKILIVATDAVFHPAGYYPVNDKDVTYLPPNDLWTRPEALADDINAECASLDHPDGDALRKAFEYRDIYPIFLAANATTLYVESQNAWYADGSLWDAQDWFGDEFGYDFEGSDGLVNYYYWALKDYIGVDGAVYFMDKNATEFISIVDSALADVVELACPDGFVDPPTTTTTTTTTAAPTPAPIADGTTTEAAGAGAPVGAIAGAAGGAAGLGLLGAGLFGAKKMGLLFNGNSMPDAGTTSDAVHVEAPQEREQFEGITGELFA